MITQQPLPQRNQITELNLTQLTLIDPNYMPKKSNNPPIEGISGGKLPNLVGDWMISVSSTQAPATTMHNAIGFRDQTEPYVSTLQAFNVKTKAKKKVSDTLTYTHNASFTPANGAQYADVMGFGDWIVMTINNYINGINIISIQAYNIQTEEKRAFITTAEMCKNITITALNDVWGVMVCAKANSPNPNPTGFGFGAPVVRAKANRLNPTGFGVQPFTFGAPLVQTPDTYVLTLFNVQTGTIKKLSTNNQKNISLKYRASFHPAIIFQDDTGMHIFDYEQGKELEVLPGWVGEVPRIKPTTKGYLESISKANPSVENIIAGDLQLGDVLVTTLINALPYLKALQRLDLRGNKLTDESAKYLYMAVQKYPQLLEIHLDNNAISADWQQAIAERLKRNQPKPAVVKAKKTDIEAPHEYSCPLSFKIMLDPVKASDDETYEREEIEKWMEKNKTSPITRAPFTSNLLTPNESIKKLIQDFLDANPDMRESDKLYLSNRLITQCVNALKIRDSQALMQALGQDTRLLTVVLENDQTLLLLACQQECPTILKIVIERLSKQNRWTQAMDVTKRSEWQLFHLTIKHTALEGAKLLTQALGWSRVDLERLLFDFDFKDTAEVLIRLGAPLHHWNAEGQTPLHYAVTIEDIELIKLLIELGADTKALNADKQRPAELALALGKPELALAIDTQKQQRKLAGFMQPLLISLQQQSEQISLLQEENRLLRQCLATMVAGMSAASNSTTDLSKHLIQSFSQFSRGSTGLKSPASSNNPPAGSFFHQSAPKKSVIPVVMNDNYSCEKVEKLLQHCTQDSKDVVLSPMVDTAQNIQSITKPITDFLKQRAVEIKTQQKGEKRLIIPLSVNDQFVSVCIMFKTKTLQESPCITYVDSTGNAMLPVISNELQFLFPQSKLVQAYEKAQTPDNNCAPWMIETVRNILASEAPLNPGFDIEKAKSEHEKILMSQAAMMRL